MPEATSMQQQYIFESDSMEEYDIFVSHATEDKKSFSNEFVELLQKDFGLNDISINWRESIWIEIDKGLKKSKFGVVILSHSYIRKYWINYELEDFFQKESNGRKLILPI